MKGISTIIATIILVVITIGLIATAWLFSESLYQEEDFQMEELCVERCRENEGMFINWHQDKQLCECIWIPENYRFNVSIDQEECDAGYHWSETEQRCNENWLGTPEYYPVNLTGRIKEGTYGAILVNEKNLRDKK